MSVAEGRYAPGTVRDGIISVLSQSSDPLHVREIERRVTEAIGPTPASSIRSFLRLNTPDLFVRQARGVYSLNHAELAGIQTPLDSEAKWMDPYAFGQSTIHHADCLQWLGKQADSSFHAVVTDPPYTLHEYSEEQQAKLRAGRGGVWRIPPAFDGHVRAAVPRFTILRDDQLAGIRSFFFLWAQTLLPKLAPGANVLVASNPLVSFIVSGAMAEAGLERRGEIVRLTMTLRGGDRPKSAHDEFPDVSVMPRSMWEPWLIFRKPLEGNVRENIRKWGIGGFRRPSKDRPFGDVIRSAPTRKQERDLAPHPSLKPQAFLRQVVRAALPLGRGVILDPFAGAGSTLAAAEAVGYRSVGVEKDADYFQIAKRAIPKLAEFKVRGD